MIDFLIRNAVFTRRCIVQYVRYQTKLMLAISDKNTLTRQMNTFIQIIMFHRLDCDILKINNDANIFAKTFLLKVGKQKLQDLMHNNFLSKCNNKMDISEREIFFLLLFLILKSTSIQILDNSIETDSLHMLSLRKKISVNSYSVASKILMNK